MRRHDRRQQGHVAVAALGFAADEFDHAGNRCFAEVGDDGNRPPFANVNRRAVEAVFAGPEKSVEGIIAEVGAPHLKLQLDLYHLQVTEGDLQKRTERLFPLTAHVQIAGNPERNEPDVGEANHMHLLEVLDRLGFQGFVGLEYKPKTTTAAGLGWAAKYGIKV